MKFNMIWRGVYNVKIKSNSDKAPCNEGMRVGIEHGIITALMTGVIEKLSARGGSNSARTKGERARVPSQI